MTWVLSGLRVIIGVVFGFVTVPVSPLAVATPTESTVPVPPLLLLAANSCATSVSLSRPFSIVFIGKGMLSVNTLVCVSGVVLVITSVCPAGQALFSVTLPPLSKLLFTGTTE
jgi:hypothetical protein